MTIRNKLFLTFFCLCLVLTGAITSLVVIATQISSINNFESTAMGQLLRIDDVFTQYAQTGKQSVEYLAQSPLLKGGLGKTDNSFLAKTEVTENTYEMYSEYDRTIYDEFRNMQLSHPYYGLIFVGFSDGTVIEANEPGKPNDTFGGGYDPRKRPWYTQAMEKSSNTNISLPYLSSSGFVVCSVTAKVQNLSGAVTGVVAVDFNLSGLTDYLAKLRIGQTGHVVVLSPDGLIMANPTNPGSVFKNVNESPKTEQAFFEQMLSNREGHFELSAGGKDYLVLTHTTPSFGWLVAVLIDKQEVMAESVHTRNQILVFGLVLSLILLTAVFFVAKSMTKPIMLLADASGRIAGGDFSALPDGSRFKGELKGLHASLERMIANLKTLIEEGRSKTEEAEEQTRNAHAALADADKARMQAEAARREGILAAAGQLDGIVRQTQTDTGVLTGYIGKASQGASNQRLHAAETSSAMTQMNSTVQEVARSCVQATNSANNTTEKARTGADTVSAVQNAIADVTRKTDSLKTAITDLGHQASGISQIMTVITDIADQTNLLALNAAIEAARAGEAGRGFAVVADEVRKLAEKTMSATKEVGDAIKSIQTGTQGSVRGMEEAAHSVAKSTELATMAEEALREIVVLSQDTANEIQSIAAASEEQSATSEHIALGMEEINHIAVDTAQAMDDAESSVSGLSDRIRELEKIIGDMKKS